MMSEEKIINIGKDDEYKVNTICNNVIQACRELDKVLEERAIETLKNRTGFRIDYKCKNCGSGGTTIIPPEVFYGKEIDIALNYIDKQQKVIDLMAEHIVKYGKVCVENYGANKEEWIEYFEKKVEEENGRDNN